MKINQYEFGQITNMAAMHSEHRSLVDKRADA